MKQTEQIVRHIQDFGSISPSEALSEYGIMRLASRICDLKKSGYKIETRFERSKNRYGEPVKYARYSFAEGGASDA